MAVTFLWIIAPAFVFAVVAAAYATQIARREKSRVAVCVRELQGRDQALEQFVRATLPAVAESMRTPGAALPAIEVPAGLERSRFAQLLWQVGERYREDLGQIQVEAADRAQWAIKEAEDAVRATIEGSSRDVTSAAIRSFGTSVVSLGADVSKVVSAALRTHRGDAVYETLIRIDHSVQQMIRQAQSYVIVSGGLPGRRWPQQSLTDVVGGAIGRVRDYLRVRPNQLDRMVISRTVEPLVHTLATLLDNALRYSPPTSFVDVSFQEGHHGVTILVDDAGVRMNAEQMEDARQILANERMVDILELGPSPRVGFPGIAALVRRYGFAVFVDGPNAYGGVRAMVYIPESLLVSPTVVEQAPVANAVVESEPIAPVDSEDESECAAAVAVTAGGLPKRRRRALTPLTEQQEDAPQLELARPDIAAAWHSGSRSGRAAISFVPEASDDTEVDDTKGMTL